MSKVPLWLRLWKLIDERGESFNSIFDLVRSSDIHPANTYYSLIILEEIGLINLVRVGRVKEVHLTQKFFNTREVFRELHDAIIRQR